MQVNILAARVRSAYGPTLNAAAVLLSCYRNVPLQRATQVIGVLPGIPVSAGWVDEAAARVSMQLGEAEFGQAVRSPP